MNKYLLCYLTPAIFTYMFAGFKESQRENRHGAHTLSFFACQTGPRIVHLFVNNLFLSITLIETIQSTLISWMRHFQVVGGLQ